MVPILGAEYTISYSYPFQITMLLIGLAWGVWVLLNLWIWQKTKAQGNLLMLIGSAILAVCYIIRAFDVGPSSWVDVGAIITLSIGFFMSVRPMVEANLAKLRGGSKNPS